MKNDAKNSQEEDNQEEEELIQSEEEFVEEEAVLDQNITEEASEHQVIHSGNEIQICAVIPATTKNISCENSNSNVSPEEIQTHPEYFKTKINENFQDVFLINKPNTKPRAHSRNVFTSHLLYTQNDANIQDSSKQKTVFTKQSEEMYNNLVKNGKINRNSFYDDLVTEKYLSKVVEKSASSNRKITKSFLERFQVYSSRKSIGIKDSKSTCNATKSHLNNENFNEGSKTVHFMGEIRSPKKYLQDQMAFLENKRKDIESLRESINKENEKNFLQKPEICKNSTILVKKIDQREDKDIYTRLYEETNHRQKSLVLYQNKGAEINETNVKKLNEKDIQKLVDKLYTDAKETNARRRLKSEDKSCNSYMSAAYSNRAFSASPTKLYSSCEKDTGKIPEESYEILTDSSKYVVMSKFIKCFELALINLFKKKIEDNPLISFDEYCSLIFNLGFVVYDHKQLKQFLSFPAITNRTIEAENNFKQLNEMVNRTYSAHRLNAYINTDSLNNKISHISNEPKFIMDESTIKKLDKELLLVKDSWKVVTKKKLIDGSEKVETNIILIFMLSVLGLYKEESKNEEIVNEKDIIDDLKSIHSEMSSTKKKTVSKKSLALTVSSGDKQTSHFLKQEIHNKNLMKLLPPSFNLKAYSYETKTARQLKSFFRTFYDNRSNFIHYLKSQQDEKKLSQHTINLQLTFIPKISAVSKKKAVRCRIKSVENAQRESQRQGDVMFRKGNLQLDEAYEILRRKKKRELLLLKKKKEDDELAQCTFMPNSSHKLSNDRGRSQEASKRLYSNAMNKLLRIKSIYVEKKALDYSFEKESKECTFSPTITKLNNQIFAENSIKSDPLVQSEVDRYEKARIEKKLKDYIYRKGVNSLNRVKTSNDLLREFQKDNLVERFKFDNEAQTNKDTFGKFCKNETLSKQKEKEFNGNRTMTKTPINSCNNSEKLRPTENKKKMELPPKDELPDNDMVLFTIVIKINGEKKDILTFCANDDPFITAQKFCLKNNFDRQTRNQIIQMIEEKLKII